MAITMAAAVELLLIGLLASVAAADLAAAVLTMPLIVAGVFATEVGVMSCAFVGSRLAMVLLAGHSDLLKTAGPRHVESGTPSRGKAARDRPDTRTVASQG